METRRTFIKTVGTGAAFTALAGISATAATRVITSKAPEIKSIRIGIIGAENSHTVGFGKMFNIDKKFPGVEVKYLWGETDEFARKAATDGQIPNIVNDPREMMGKIDALIVDHRHAKYHLDAARPFLGKGIPMFIDKPFCYRVSEGKEFLALARQSGTPVTSYSTISHNEATFDLKKQLEELGKVDNVVRYGPADLESPYGGIFFYGIHLLEPLMYMFGDDIERVRVNRNGNRGSINLIFNGGMFTTLVIKSLSHGWSTFIETKDTVMELKPRITESEPSKAYIDMVEMFRTGKEPRRHESILKCIAVLEAMEQSATTEQWVNVEWNT